MLSCLAPLFSSPSNVIFLLCRQNSNPYRAVEAFVALLRCCTVADSSVIALVTLVCRAMVQHCLRSSQSGIACAIELLASASFTCQSVGGTVNPDALVMYGDWLGVTNVLYHRLETRSVDVDPYLAVFSKAFLAALRTTEPRLAAWTQVMSLVEVKWGRVCACCVVVWFTSRRMLCCCRWMETGAH